MVMTKSPNYNIGKEEPIVSALFHHLFVPLASRKFINFIVLVINLNKYKLRHFTNGPHLTLFSRWSRAGLGLAEPAAGQLAQVVEDLGEADKTEAHAETHQAFSANLNYYSWTLVLAYNLQY